MRDVPRPSAPSAVDGGPSATLRARRTQQRSEQAARLGWTYHGTGDVAAGRPDTYACLKGHRRQISPNQVQQQKASCAACRGADLLRPFEVLAKERLGRLLTAEWPGFNGKLRLRCAEGHEFVADVGSVRGGSWCPECATSIRERLCRAAMEAFFGVPFLKSRPEWLQRADARGRALEFDGHNPAVVLAGRTHEIAFEHQGGQHFAEVPHWGGPALLASIQRNDAWKRERCAERGVVLIELRLEQADLRNPVPALQAQVSAALTACGLPLPSSLDAPVDISKAWSFTSLLELQEVARAAGLRCTSEQYVGHEARYKFECLARKEHRCSLGVRELRMLNGCPKCAREQRQSATSDARLTEIATICKGHINAGKPGVLRSSQFIGDRLRYVVEVQCGCGDIFQMRLHSLRRGDWCTRCGLENMAQGNRTPFAKIQEAGRRIGLEVPDQPYKRVDRPLQAQCHNTRSGVPHSYTTTADSVLAGKGCKPCSRERVYATYEAFAVQAVRDYVHSRGGTCGAVGYASMPPHPPRHVTVTCAAGHTWPLPTSSVRYGRWCTRCHLDAVNARNRVRRPAGAGGQRVADKEFAQKLRALGKSVDAVARATGYSTHSVRSWLCGHSVTAAVRRALEREYGLR